jgi:glycine oxidase
LSTYRCPKMPQLTSNTSDVLIIGGGIIGCSIAWRLAQAGMKVTVLDRGEPGMEASWAAAGMLAPVGEQLEPLVFSDLCIASRGLYPRFAAEIEESTGQSVGYRRDGSLLVALDEKQEEDLRQIHQTQTAHGFKLQPLTQAEILGRAPQLSPEIRSGLFVPEDHWVDNQRLMRGLLAACEHAGVQIQAGCAVREFHTESDRVDSAIVDGGAHYVAKTFVLAAGCWSGEVVGWQHSPLIPCAGQMMEFELCRDIPFVVRAGIHYLVPRPEYRILLGTTAEYRGYEKAVTAKGLQSILENTVRLVPQVGDGRFLRAWSGLRPDTPDHLPLLGYGEAENLVFATGHFRNGILLAPVTAEIVSDLILKGATSRPLEAYRPTRFKTVG